MRLAEAGWLWQRWAGAGALALLLPPRLSHHSKFTDPFGTDKEAGGRPERQGSTPQATRLRRAVLPTMIH
jgi:hypothetical protein